MSDRTPLASDVAPPAYTQEATNQGASFQGTPREAPPPYTPAPAPNTSSSTYNHVISSENQHLKFETEGENRQTITVLNLGPDPVQLICPYCGRLVITDIEYRFGALTVLSAILCFFFCVVCTFLPFCINGLQDVEHHCPNCHCRIGGYSRL